MASKEKSWEIKNWKSDTDDDPNEENLDDLGIDEEEPPSMDDESSTNSLEGEEF